MGDGSWLSILRLTALIRHANVNSQPPRSGVTVQRSCWDIVKSRGNDPVDLAMWVVTLDSEEGWNEVAIVGGKAAGLHRLLRNGFRVPKGYVLTTDAFRHALREPLFGLKTPQQMRGAILNCEIPVEIERAIRDIHEEMFLNSEVAVRSSGIEEDTHTLSYAGQLESVLGVRGVEALLKAIKSVWASYFSQPHLLYRGRVSLDTPPSYIAVVVQRMLQPRAAGVMFTADPVSGETGRLVISAAAGLGDAVVDGLSTETAYVDLKTRRVVQHIPAAADSALILQKGDIECMADAANRVNQVFGRPQDMEWALDDRGLTFLQSRPITTGSHRSKSKKAAVWSNVNVGEALPGVGTPMTWSIIRSFARRGFEMAFGALGLSVPKECDLVSSFRGRVYLNLTEFASIASQVPFLSVENLLAVGGGGGFEELHRIGFQRRSQKTFWAKLPVTLARIATSQVVTPTLARRWSKRFHRRRDDFLSTDFRRLDWMELLSVLGEIDRIFDRTGIIMLACGSNFLSSYILTRELLRRWGGEEAAAKERHLFSGLRGLASAEPGLELLDMARYVSRHPSLAEMFKQMSDGLILRELARSEYGQVLQQKMDGFLAEYGLRAPREAEISTPRWRETPEFLIEIIRRHLESPYLPSSEEIEQEREAFRQETTQMIRQYFRTGLGLAFRLILKWTQENARLREDLRACVTDTLAMYRHFFLEVGRRLVKQGFLAHREDVFFLTASEVFDCLQKQTGSADMAVIVATRRASYTAFKESRDPPDTFVLDVEGGIHETTLPPPEGTPTLQGLSASPGRITGRARVLTDWDVQTELHPGEILVAPYTDVGWTPLFLIATGVVTDMGGPLSHAAVVAREYGIPAVVNAKNATTLIKTGDLITVDGNHGRVYLQP